MTERDNTLLARALIGLVIGGALLSVALGIGALIGVIALGAWLAGLS